jgi:hypothetical protein
MGIHLIVTRPAPPVPVGPVDDEWYDGYYNTSFWNPDDPDWGEWDAINEKWIPAATYPYEVDLNVKTGTTWAEGYRPTGIRFVIENDPGDLLLSLSAESRTLVSGDSVSNDAEVVFGSQWQWPTGDLSYMYIYSDTEAEGWAITGIEFYTDTTSSFNDIQCEFTVFGDSPEKVLWADNLKTLEQGDLYLTGSPNQPDRIILNWPTDIGKGQVVHITNIEFLNGSTWEQKFDNTYWTNTGDFTWANGRWESSADGAELTATGTWADTYYPTAIRFNFVVEVAGP